MTITKWDIAQVRGTAFDESVRPDPSGKEMIDDLIDAVNAGAGGVDFASGGKFRATIDATEGLAIGAHPFGPDLPADARVVFAGYETVTTLASATTAATIKLGPASDDDGIKAATVISDGTWAVGPHNGLPGWALTAATDKTTVAGKLVATVAVEDLTDGLVIVFGDYAVTG